MVISMSKASRAKGRRGETCAKALLTERDFIILADTSAGVSQADLIARDEMGTVWAVEAKNTKAINVPAYRTQAKTQAGKLHWLLLCKLDGTSSWLVMGKNRKATVWHERDTDGNL